MATTARDIMQTGLVTVAPETPLSVVERLFVEEEIHGAPVVDAEGRVLGVITSTDLMRTAGMLEELRPSEPSYFRGDLDLHGFDWERAPVDLRERLADVVAGDAMTTDLVSVAPGASVASVARTLREQAVHRVLVVEDGELLGLVSAMDLVALLERAEPEPERASRKPAGGKSGKKG